MRTQFLRRSETNAGNFIQICLLALFIAAPAHAADVIWDGACALQDSITAASTDSPAADRAIRSGGSYGNLRAEAGLSGDRVRRFEGGALVDVLEGPVDADGFNWNRAIADDELEGWIAEAPARSFNSAYNFVSFDCELPPAAPDPMSGRIAARTYCGCPLFRVA